VDIVVDDFTRQVEPTGTTVENHGIPGHDPLHPGENHIRIGGQLDLNGNLPLFGTGQDFLAQPT
jgi:hypothetical protein